jgi:hypothetical protein
VFCNLCYSSQKWSLLKQRKWSCCFHSRCLAINFHMYVHVGLQNKVHGEGNKNTRAERKFIVWPIPVPLIFSSYCVLHWTNSCFLLESFHECHYTILSVSCIYDSLWFSVKISYSGWFIIGIIWIFCCPLSIVHFPVESNWLLSTITTWWQKWIQFPKCCACKINPRQQTVPNIIFIWQFVQYTVI